MARSVGDKLQSCTSSHSFVVTFVHKRCWLLLMSANSWEEAKCMISTRAPGKLTLPRSRLSTDGAMWMAHTVTPWQNDRPSLLNLQVYFWSWALIWSEHSGYEPHGEIENWSSPGLLLCLLLEAEKIQLCWTEVCILTMTTLISLYFCFSILSAAFWRPKLLFYDWSANFNSLVDQIRCSIPTLGFRWMHIRGNEIRNYNDCRKDASVLF